MKNKLWKRYIPRNQPIFTSGAVKRSQGTSSAAPAPAAQLPVRPRSPLGAGGFSRVNLLDAKPRLTKGSWWLKMPSREKHCCVFCGFWTTGVIDSFYFVDCIKTIEIWWKLQLVPFAKYIAQPFGIQWHHIPPVFPSKSRKTGHPKVLSRLVKCLRLLHLRDDVPHFPIILGSDRHQDACLSLSSTSHDPNDSKSEKNQRRKGPNSEEPRCDLLHDGLCSYKVHSILPKSSQHVRGISMWYNSLQICLATWNPKVSCHRQVGIHGIHSRSAWKNVGSPNPLATMR